LAIHLQPRNCQLREAGTTEWFPCQVPGSVQTDLLALNRIPDPFVADNELQVQWVTERDWEYRLTFHASADLLAEARFRFPDVPLYLGCMRPKGGYRHELDPLAVRAGLNVLVSPSRPARQMAADLGLATRESRECCVL